jgi:hypothetical protein
VPKPSIFRTLAFKRLPIEIPAPLAGGNEGNPQQSGKMETDEEKAKREEDQRFSMENMEDSLNPSNFVLAKPKYGHLKRFKLDRQLKEVKPPKLLRKSKI